MLICMYVYLRFGSNWATNIGGVANKFSLFVFISLNSSISKTVRDADPKFCSQVGLKIF